MVLSCHVVESSNSMPKCDKASKTSISRLCSWLPSSAARKWMFSEGEWVYFPHPASCTQSDLPLFIEIGEFFSCGLDNIYILKREFDRGQSCQVLKGSGIWNTNLKVIFGVIDLLEETRSGQVDFSVLEEMLCCFASSTDCFLISFFFFF